MTVLTLANLFIISLVWFLLECTLLSEGLPSGAPESSCMSMSPQHFASTQPPQSSPYAVKAFLKRDPHKSVVHVSIVPRNGHFGGPFKGFIVQARLAGNPSVIVDGQFFTNDGGLSKTFVCGSGNCGFNTWTHKSAEVKPRASAIWIPPQGFVGVVTFKATIVASKATFWENQFSDRIELSPNEPPPQQPQHPPPPQHPQLPRPQPPPRPQQQPPRPQPQPQPQQPKPQLPELVNQQVLEVDSKKVEDVLPSAVTNHLAPDESEDEDEAVGVPKDDDDDDEEDDDFDEEMVEADKTLVESVETKEDDEEDLGEIVGNSQKESEEEDEEGEEDVDDDEAKVVKPVSKVGDDEDEEEDEPRDLI